MTNGFRTDVRHPNSCANSGQTSLLAPVWRILESVLGNVQNRFDLLRIEAQEEKIRLLAVILLASAIIVFGTLALSATCFFVIFFVWSDSPPIALSELSYGPLITLGALIATYALAAAWAGSALRKRLAGPAPFAATSEELRKDRECIPHP